MFSFLGEGKPILFVNSLKHAGIPLPRFQSLRIYPKAKITAERKELYGRKIISIRHGSESQKHLKGLYD